MSKVVLVRSFSTASAKAIWEKVDRASKGAPEWPKRHIVEVSSKRARAVVAKRNGTFTVKKK